jgi:hypothetical protein
MLDIYVYFNPDLPLSCPGLISENDDGTYTVLLNPAFTRERLTQTLVHEFRHAQIDFGLPGIDVGEIEMLRHNEE